MKNEDKKGGVSRRKLLQGAITAAAIASTGALSACEHEKKLLPLGGTDEMKTLAAWLAAVSRPNYDDFTNMSTYNSTDLSNKIAGDMSITGSGKIQKIKDLIESVRTANHSAYNTVQQELSGFSGALYPPNQCPKNYATLVAMSKL